MQLGLGLVGPAVERRLGDAQGAGDVGVHETFLAQTYCRIHHLLSELLLSHVRHIPVTSFASTGIVLSRHNEARPSVIDGRASSRSCSQTAQYSTCERSGSAWRFSDLSLCLRLSLLFCRRSASRSRLSSPASAIASSRSASSISWKASSCSTW